MSDELCYLDAVDMVQKIRDRELSPVELLQAHLDRIDSLNPKFNAIVTLIDDAMAQARNAEAAVVQGDPLGVLHGLPFTVKDCVDTRAVRTTRGSKLFAEHVPPTDATVVTRLRQAGGVCMAKTNMPEFALWGETDNAVFGRTVNPWNVERSAGGSSGGEGAALCAGMSPLGVGSDVAGSIRIPAAQCGIVGLKPTHGRIPLTGHWPPMLLRAMHVGPMARSVRDVGLALGVMAGPDGVDPYALPVPPPDLTRISDLPKGLRVGWIVDKAFGPVDPEVRETVVRAAETLSGAGCEVEEVSFPLLERIDTHDLTLKVYGLEGSHYLAPLIAGREGELSRNIRARLDRPAASMKDYFDALQEWELLREEAAEFFRTHHLLLVPGHSCPAHEHFPDTLQKITIAGETVSARSVVVRSNLPWNMTGSPALVLPFGLSDGGLPIGVELVGRHFEEATVLRAANALEQVADPRIRRPPL